MNIDITRQLGLITRSVAEASAAATTAFYCGEAPTS